MALIGIACNPQSGKDVRRLLTAATTIDDTEKLNILERILLSAAAVGRQQVCIMPDRLGYGRLLLQKGRAPGYPGDLSQLQICQMQTTETQSDTTAFAARMEAEGADVLIVMGGDGTSRAAARGTCRIPTISLSTGTNNVYPKMLEGTVVGVAAAVLAGGKVPLEVCTAPAKCIEISVNGHLRDLALVDAAFCRNPFVGARAIWNYEEITRVVVTQCSMASIGFSALAGTMLTVRPEDARGALAEFSDRAANTLAPVGAGALRGICVERAETLRLDQTVTWTMTEQGTLALDGEREIAFRPGDVIGCTVRRRGPLRVDVRRCVEFAREMGLFRLGQE